jgi:hypothetical protein
VGRWLMGPTGRYCYHWWLTFLPFLYWKTNDTPYTLDSWLVSMRCSVWQVVKVIIPVGVKRDTLSRDLPEKQSSDLRQYDMNGRSQMQGGKNLILPKEINANRFFWDSHWLDIWIEHLCPLWDRMERAWLWALFTPFWSVQTQLFSTCIAALQ